MATRVEILCDFCGREADRESDRGPWTARALVRIKKKLKKRKLGIFRRNYKGYYDCGYYYREDFDMCVLCFKLFCEMCQMAADDKDLPTQHYKMDKAL